MSKIIAFLILFFTINSLSAAEFARSFAPRSVGVGKGVWEAHLKGSYLETINQFDIYGNLGGFENKSFNRLEQELTLRYGFNDRFELSVGGRYRTNNSETETTSVSTAGFESYFVSGKYSFKPVKKFYYSFDVKVRNAVYSNTEYLAANVPDDELVLGDGGTFVSFGPQLTYRRTKSNYLSASVFYNIPPHQMSHELEGEAEIAWSGKSATFLVGVNGVYSFEQDKYGNTPEEKPQIARGTTLLYNSIDRSWVKPYVGLNFGSARWRFELRAAQVVEGAYVDKYNEYSLAIAFRSASKKGKEKVSEFKSYNVEASVIKVSPKETYVRIDQGIGGGVTKGMRFDIYRTDFFGGNVLLASGSVFKAGADWAIVKLLKKYRKQKIKNGDTARGY